MSKAVAGSRVRKGIPPHPAKALRRKAQALVGAQKARPPELLGPEATQHLLHELYLHQLELELQNLELRKVQEQLETSRKRCVDLYDYAPVGYLTLNKSGLILDANLTSAMLLGLSRRELHRQPLARFVLAADQEAYSLHWVRNLQSGASNSCELRMLRRDAPPFWARLETRASSHGEGDPGLCRVVISDITEPKLDQEGLGSLTGEAAEELNALLEIIRDEIGVFKAVSGPAAVACRQLDSIVAACARGWEVLNTRSYCRSDGDVMR